MTLRRLAWAMTVLWFLECLGFAVWALVTDRYGLSLIFIAFVLYASYRIGELVRIDRMDRKARK